MSEKHYDKTIIIMCGPSGSGKSTMVQKIKDTYAIEPNTKIASVSRDEIRFSILDSSEAYFAREVYVYKQFIETAKILIDTYDIIIIDATHLTTRSRRKTINALAATFNKYHVNLIVCYTNVPSHICKIRNGKRTGRAKVPLYVIDEQFSRYTFPTCDEGFDAVYEINKKSEIKLVDKYDVFHF